MNIVDLLSRLSELGINIQLAGDKLKISGAEEKLTPSLIDEIKSKKEEVIAFLKENVRNTIAYESLEVSEDKEYYRLSSAQNRLFILYQMELDSIIYNLPYISTIDASINIGNVEEVFNKLLSRHESLRTSFELIDESPVQIIHNPEKFRVEYLGCVSPLEAIKDFIRPFDLSKAPLMRVGVIDAKETGYILVIDMHHIITDGTTQKILEKEFVALLSGMALQPLKLQYKDYSEWQNSRKALEAIKLQEDYWMQVFPGEIPLLDIPTDYPRPSIQSYEGNSLDFDLNVDESKRLKELARQEGDTLFMIILAAFNIFLAKVSNQEDIVIGTPVAGRRHADLEQIVGIFINTLVLRNDLSGSKFFKDFLVELKEKTLGAFENQDYPFEDLVEKVQVERDMSRNPIFDVMFILQNMFDNSGGVPEIGKDSKKTPPYIYAHKTSKFDLTLTAAEIGEKICFSLEYCIKLFQEETILRYITYFKNIITGLLENTEKKIFEIEILSREDKKKILYEFNDTYIEFPGEKLIHELFEEQVVRTPDHNAVVDSIFSNERAKCITYRELNDLSGRLAYSLIENGVEPGSIVAIIIERSVQMIIGILGILKAGGAYLPIDPDFPHDRIDFMLKDSGAKTLVTTNLVEEAMGLDRQLSIVNNKSLMNLLAYVIFTSGSTGKPKGVMIEHRSVVNFIAGITVVIPFTEVDRVLSLTTISFDIFGLETLVPLVIGSLVVMGGREEQSDIATAAQLISSEAVTIIQITPSRLSMFIAEGDCAICLKSLKYVLVGGETFPLELLERTREMIAGKIYNLYGPTETTIWSTVKDVSRGNVLNIGKPIANTQVYILNKNGHLQPIGVVGELFIGGNGLARGYLNRPMLTADRFFVNHSKMFDYSTGSFDSLIGNTKMIYRTGDLTRFLQDGNIEFISRVDHQVKIRGYRVELGEIESCLRTNKGVKDAVVVVKEDTVGDKYLCAYVVTDRDIDIQLKKYLRQSLPEYMIPSYFIQLDKIPLTQNGKLDRKALPLTEFKMEGSFTAPRNEDEAKLAELWMEVLGRDKETIGIDANFFELGGHSLKVTRLVAKIHRELNIILPIAQVFKSPTIRGLAEYISGAIKEKFYSIEPAEDKEYYRLSSAQNRLFFIHLMEPKSLAYNLPTFVVLVGLLDKDKIKEIFTELIDRHESLRTSFVMLGEAPGQVIHETVCIEIDYYDIVDNEEKTRKCAQDFVRSFDLSQAPLLRVGLIKDKENSYILMVDMHHIITDGISLDILVNDFNSLFIGDELPHLKLQYRDFSEWQNRQYESGVVKKQEEYWLSRFKDGVVALNLPSDFTRPELFSSSDGDIIFFKVSRELTARFKNALSKAGTTVTMYMFLLAVYNVLLSKYSGKDDIVIGSPITGRRHIDLENIIGIFINMLSIRNFPGKDKTFREFLLEVKENALNAYENQDYQFEELVSKLDLRGVSDRNPLFSVVFADLNLQKQGRKGESALMMKTIAYEKTTSKFDLRLAFTESNGEIILSLTYSTVLFKRSTAEKMTKRFLEILQQVLEDLDIKIKDIMISHDLVLTKSETLQDYQEGFDF